MRFSVQNSHGATEKHVTIKNRVATESIEIIKADQRK
jgi:hypothetical protein